MVRARMQTHLEALKKRSPDLLGECEIQESMATDYAYRLFVQKAAWMQVLAGLAEETDHDNFTSEVGIECKRRDDSAALRLSRR